MGIAWTEGKGVDGGIVAGKWPYLYFYYNCARSAEEMSNFCSPLGWPVASFFWFLSLYAEGDPTKSSKQRGDIGAVSSSRGSSRSLSNVVCLSFVLPSYLSRAAIDSSDIIAMLYLNTMSDL